MEVTPIGQHPMLADVGPTDSAEAVGKGHGQKGVSVGTDSTSISEEAVKRLDVVGAKERGEASSDVQIVGAAEEAEERDVSVAHDIVGQDTDSENQPEILGTSGGEVSAREAAKLRQLRERHDEVHAHERAHAGAGGRWMHGASTYQYVTGPDGKQYALGGESRIDMSPVANDPMATVRKMQQVRRAALAPLQPSSQDRMIARQAVLLESQAREMLQVTAEESVVHNNLGIGGEAAGAIVGSVKQESRYEPPLPEPLDIIGEERGIFAPPDAKNSLASYQKVQPVGDATEPLPKSLKDTVA